MNIKLSHLFGGILGGVAFGLASGLLLGSCVFQGGPNHAAAGGGAGQVSAAEAAPPMAGGMPPAGMDPGSGSMESVFGRLAELKTAIEQDPKNRPALVDLGNLYYDASKFEQAASLYERAAAIDRADPNLLTDLANCYMFQQQLPKALALLKEVQERYPQHWQSAANLFYLAVTQKDALLAKEAIEKMKRLNPSFERLPEMEKLYEDLSRGGRS